MSHNTEYQPDKIISKEINDRVIELMGVLDMSEYQFSKELGFNTNSTIRGITKGHGERGRQKPGYDTLMLIIDRFAVNPTWLMTGKPPMFGQENAEISASLNREKVITVERSGGSSIVLVDQKAAAGYVKGVHDVEYVEKLPAFNLPGFTNANFRAFEIDGESMEPTLWQGDWIVCTQVEELTQVREGYIHIIVLTDGSIVAKRAVPNEKGLLLKSDNKEYPPYKVAGEEISEVWRASARLTRYMGAPSNLDVRLTTVEFDVGELRKQMDRMLKKKS